MFQRVEIPKLSRVLNGDEFWAMTNCSECRCTEIWCLRGRVHVEADAEHMHLANGWTDCGNVAALEADTVMPHS